MSSMRTMTRTIVTMTTAMALVATMGCDFSSTNPGPTEQSTHPMLDFDDLPPCAWGDFDDPVVDDAIDTADAIDAGEEMTYTSADDYSNVLVGILATSEAALAGTLVTLPPLAVIAYLADGTRTQVDPFTAVYTNYVDIDGWVAMGEMTVTFVWTGWTVEVALSTADGLFTDVQYVDGFVSLDLADGLWTVHNVITGVVEAEVGWAEDASGSELTVSNYGPWEFDGALEAAGGAATITFEDLANAVDFEVLWNADGSGQVIHSDYDGGAPSCWDALGVNTPC